MDPTHRRTSTVQQLQLLVEFAEANKELALGRLRSKEARALSARLWRECAESLNAEGPARQPKEWAKVWTDMKSRVRSKLMTLAMSQRGTGGGPSLNVMITPLENRVAEIIGRDVGPIPNVAQNQLQQASIDENVQEVEEVGMRLEMHESVEVEYVDNMYEQIQLNEPRPSHDPLSTSPRPSTQSSPQPSPQPSLRRSPVVQSLSVTSTPRRRRRGRHGQRSRQRPYIGTRGPRLGQAQTSRSALDESRNIMVRIEELRARTDSLVAESAVKQAEAAQVQAEANRIQAQALETICNSLSSLVPAVRLYLRHASKARQRLSSSDEDN